MTKITKIIFLIFISFILSGCTGGLYFALHDDPLSKSCKKIPNLTIEKGKKVLILEQTNGLMWGGLALRVASEDSDIISISNIRDGRTLSMYMRGKKIGETKLHYLFVPSYMDGNLGVADWQKEECKDCFRVKVVERKP